MEKKLLFLSFILVFTISTYNSFAFAKSNIDDVGKKVTKISCISLSEYGNLSLNKIKEILLINAKRDAISQIYGEMIYSESIVKNWKLISDMIISKSLGIIRIEGNPEYYNGKNLGEICVKINAYVTNEDLKKFELKSVELKRFCYTNPDMKLKNLKEKARESALLEIIIRNNPALKNISLEHASKLVHNFSILKEDFDFNTSSFCMDVKADIIPFELEFFNTDIDKSSVKKINLGEPNLVFQEDFSNIEDGLIPNGWIGGNTLVVKTSGRKGNKVLTNFQKGNHSFMIPNINFPENFKVNIEMITYSDCCDPIKINIGNLSCGLHTNGASWFGNSQWRFNRAFARNRDPGFFAWKKVIILITIEKTGPVFKLFVKGRQWALIRMKNFRGTNSLNFNYSGNFAIYKISIFEN